MASDFGNLDQEVPEQQVVDTDTDVFSKLFDFVPPAVFFGIVIGFMAALSSYAGTGFALIGLLFVLVGREAASWFKPEMNEQRDEFFRLVGLISLGLFIGLWIGFFAKSIEKTSVGLEIADLQTQIEALQPKAKSKKQVSTDLDLGTLKSEIDNLANRLKNPVIVIQSKRGDQHELLGLADKIEQVARLENVKTDDRTCLVEFAKTVRICSNMAKTLSKPCEILRDQKRGDLAQAIEDRFARE